MKKHILNGMLLLTLALTLTACSGSDSETNSDASSANESVTNELPSDASGQTTEPAIVAEDAHAEEELQLIDTFFEVDDYNNAGGVIEENKFDQVFDEAILGGLPLKLGMTYEEVLAAGYMPEDTTFPMTALEGDAPSSDFQDVNGKIVTLGFSGPEGGIVAEGVLYSISVDYINGGGTAPAIVIDEINNQTKLLDVAYILGDPYSIDTGAYEDYLDMKAVFSCKSKDLRVILYADLEREEILSITLEGSLK